MPVLNGTALKKSTIYRAANKNILFVIVALFVLISLYPIWSARFPPMQDYPLHLLQAHILNAPTDPAIDFDKNFQVDFRVGPYATFYCVISILSVAMPIEAAGKVSLSLYIVLIAWLVISLERRSEEDFAPWGLILFFPFALNQQYFLGNINYFYSVPLLVFALLDHESMSRNPASFRSGCRHALWPLILFFTHPLTLLIYISLAATGAFLSWRNRAEFVRGIIPPLSSALFFFIWYRVTIADELSGGLFRWQQIQSGVRWYSLIFTGMNSFEGVDRVPVFLWLAIGFLVLKTILDDENGFRRFPMRCLTFLAMTTMAVVLLPFAYVPHIAYINWRIAAVSYFFLAMLAGKLRFRGRWAGILVVLVTALLLHSVMKQVRISTEIEEIVPIVSRIPPNSHILPLVFDWTTPELDSWYFELHLHDHNYYHLLVGGGLSPYIFDGRWFPVHYKPGVFAPPPDQNNAYSFEWNQHSADYQYFLARGAPKELVVYLTGKADPIAQSENWILFKRATDH